METQTKPVTAHELFWTPDDTPTRSELIRGVIHRRPCVGMLQSHISGNVMFPLAEYVETRKLGIFIGRTGFWVERDPDSVLAPTFAFVRAGRYPEPDRDDHDFYFPGPPDLAGEVVSNDDPPKEVAARVDRWLRVGTHMVILVHVDHRTVTVSRPAADPVVLTEGGVLDGAHVIPGWHMPVSRIFDVRVSRMTS